LQLFPLPLACPPMEPEANTPIFSAALDYIALASL
jgi:hypothetical protein